MKKLLLVIDMQNDFRDGSLPVAGCNDIVEPIKKFVENYDGEYIFTQDTHSKRRKHTVENDTLPRHCTNNTRGHCIVPELAELAKEHTLKVWNSFNKGRDIRLSYYEPIQIDICGVCTDICVLTTALFLRSKLPFAKIIVHKDLCKGLTEEAHKAALLVMKNCLIDIVDGDSFMLERTLR